MAAADCQLIVDADEHSKEQISELFGFRWNSEVDIRTIKSSLNLAHVRCKSPEMVRLEVWTTIPGYNLKKQSMTHSSHNSQAIHVWK